jgi:hypothetical protein
MTKIQYNNERAESMTYHLKTSNLHISLSSFQDDKFDYFVLLSQTVALSGL